MGDGGNESVAVTAGIWGFIVLFGLAIACWLLFRSMNNHLRKTQWQEEQEHPVRQRIPLAPRSATRAAQHRAEQSRPPADGESAPPDQPHQEN
ncbi:hypothetical protein [Flexivirga sp.]|uniref:hypothetical protein n=1 Tax=Flexivirga sp. TaxID=1962927 RepID=UPI003F7F061C